MVRLRKANVLNLFTCYSLSKIYSSVWRPSSAESTAKTNVTRSIVFGKIVLEILQ